jgi:putative FmdB family regulatory protein
VPTYQYACTECGHAFEQVQSFSDDALTVCPVCSGRLRKVFNAVGVVFKGSGFYRTDSRSGTSSTLAPGTSEKSGDTSSTGGASTTASPSKDSSSSSTAGSTTSGASGSSSGSSSGSGTS